MKKLVTVFALIATVVLMAGCRSAPVYNVDDATVVTSTGHEISMDQTRKAIVKAGTGLGWVMADVDPGHSVGTLVLRDHVAKVDINYTPKSYSITYKDSTNLKYDGTNIHSNYNGWIHNLQNAINAQLSAY